MHRCVIAFVVAWLSITGGAAVVSSLATVLYIADNGAYRELRAPDSSLKFADYNQAQGRALASEVGMWTAWSVTGALALSAVAVAAFTDFAGAADATFEVH